MITRLLGFAGMVTCLALVFFFETSSTATGVMRVFHWPAILLTGVGPICLVLIMFDLTVVFRGIWAALFHSPSRLAKRAHREALYLHQISKGFYEGGQKVFDNVDEKKLSEFSRKMVDRLSLRIPTQDIRDLAEIEVDKIEAELDTKIEVVSNMVKLTPSIGMLGTIMGMVNLLATLDDPSHIGGHMSLALLTTFYGLFFSIVVWAPFCQKLQKLKKVKVRACEQGLRWLELLEKRKPATMFADSVDITEKEAGQGRAA